MGNVEEKSRSKRKGFRCLEIRRKLSGKSVVEVVTTGFVLKTNRQSFKELFSVVNPWRV